jgi:hypothetical protein
MKELLCLSIASLPDYTFFTFHKTNLLFLFKEFISLFQDSIQKPGNRKFKDLIKKKKPVSHAHLHVLCRVMLNTKVIRPSLLAHDKPVTLKA